MLRRSMSSAAWDYQTAPLIERGFRCIAFDRRSHGRSDDPGRGYDYDSLAGDLHSRLTQLDVRQATLVAHSFGGGEAVRYLSMHGRDRVSRLLLLAPCTPCLFNADGNPQGLPQAAFDALRGAIAQDYPTWLDGNEEPFVVPETSRGMRNWIKAMMTQASLPGLLQCHRTMTQTDLRAEMSQLALPTLVIQGDVDQSLPLELTGRPSAALIPGAQLNVYAGAPHGLFLTHADKLNRDIVSFASS
jgi:non-heme chloroperoxidase